MKRRDQERQDLVASASRYLAEHGERVAWIMGSSRSGSSWLLRMLRGLDRVATIDDPHIGHHLSVWRPLPLAWAAADGRPRLTTLSDVKRDKPDYFFSEEYRADWMPALAQMIQRRFGAQLADQAELGSRPRLVIKEPSSHPADVLLEAIPGARLIFLLRDGRDVVDSWLDAYRDGSWAIEEGAFAASGEDRQALVEWLASVWAFRSREMARTFTRLSPERRVLIRYESLLADPVGQLRRICALIGIEVEPDRLEKIAIDHQFSRIDAGERGSLRETRRARPGGWQTSLSACEREAMEEIMGEVLDLFGYRRQTGVHAT